MKETRAWKRLTHTTRFLRAKIREHLKKSLEEMALEDGFADEPLG